MIRAQTRAQTTAPRPTSGQSGSAYILALLALLVISVLGLSLVFIAQTEMEIGSNERTIQRVFYAAESGLAISTARILVSQDYVPMEVQLDTAGLARNRADIAGARPVYVAPCNLCEVNNSGEYQGKQYVTMNVALQATGERVGGGRTLASRTLSSTVLFTPVEAPAAALIDPNLNGGQGGMQAPGGTP